MLDILQCAVVLLAVLTEKVRGEDNLVEQVIASVVFDSAVAVR